MKRFYFEKRPTLKCYFGFHLYSLIDILDFKGHQIELGECYNCKKLFITKILK